MVKELTRVSFDEFSGNLPDFFARVVREHEAVVIEGEEGQLAVLKPARSNNARRRGGEKTDADSQAFLFSFGGWKDLVDTDRLIEDILESRRLSSRPPVEL